MRPHGDLMELRDHNDARRDKAGRAWIKRRKHCGRRSSAEWEKLSSETDMYVCTFKEALCERQLSELIASLIARNVHQMMCEDGKHGSLSIELVVLRWPFEDSWFCRALEHWNKVRRTLISNYVREFRLLMLGFSLSGIKWWVSIYRRPIAFHFTFFFRRSGLSLKGTGCYAF